jgi:hypothetical protein
MARSHSRFALGLGVLFWVALLFSPLAFVQKAQAQDTESYGTVIGIVCCIPNGLDCLVPVANRRSYRIWEQHTLASV